MIRYNCVLAQNASVYSNDSIVQDADNAAGIFLKSIIHINSTFTDCPRKNYISLSSTNIRSFKKFSSEILEKFVILSCFDYKVL